MKRTQVIPIVLSTLLSGLVFTACKKSTFEVNGPETAKLMAVNLVPERTIAVGLSGNLLGQAPLSFNNYTGGYLSVYPGERSIGSFDYSTGDTLAVADHNFEVKKYYSLFVTGSSGNYQNIIVNDNIDSLSASSGKAFIRYINAINGSTSPLVTVSVGGSNIVNQNANFASVSGFVEVDPGQISIQAKEGSSIDISRTITVSAKGVYTIMFISGATAGADAQIKYILNGVLDDEDASRNSSGRTVVIQ